MYYGIEIVEGAVEAAKQNADINNIRNAEFLHRRCKRCFG